MISELLIESHSSINEPRRISFRIEKKNFIEFLSSFHKEKKILLEYHKNHL